MYHQLAFGCIACRTLLGGITESASLAEFRTFLQLGWHIVVTLPIYEGVVGCLILHDAHLGVHIVLHAEVIAVQMVGRNVQQHRDVCAEVIHVVELEGGQLYYIRVVRLFGHLQCQAVADVSGQSHVRPCLLQYMVDERGGGGLSVAACDAYHAGIGIACRKFYFAQYGCALRDELGHHGCCVGNARTLYHLIGPQHLAFGVPPFFPGDVPFVQHLPVARFDLSHV